MDHAMPFFTCLKYLLTIPFILAFVACSGGGSGGSDIGGNTDDDDSTPLNPYIALLPQEGESWSFALDIDDDFTDTYGTGTSTLSFVSSDADSITLRQIDSYNGTQLFDVTTTLLIVDDHIEKRHLIGGTTVIDAYMLGSFEDIKTEWGCFLLHPMKGVEDYYNVFAPDLFVCTANDSGVRKDLVHSFSYDALGYTCVKEWDIREVYGANGLESFSYNYGFSYWGSTTNGKIARYTYTRNNIALAADN